VGSLIAITTDPAFGSSLREVASKCGWKFWQARTVEDATPMLLTEPIPLVIYDGQHGDDDWQRAFGRLRRLSSELCVVLASPVADSNLWQEVIRLGGFDLLSRSAGRDDIVRKLMFAWFCTENARKQER
jgi:ActR/RegA family two-component response regulator